ncbi:ABC transporter substrate-binding protein [Frankia sp. R82]|uniref:ABC transporter substrate-binding protein n=1 Tax=Frankia sp. R82 TaxID=2950553 RepID=UPI0020435B73|nr:ABC transporter substrate-binding protein [Frankia sp. R82]MCM3883217.1 ABC transporter substrate-binding protein [Frankia sp. R82]
MGAERGRFRFGLAATVVAVALGLTVSACGGSSSGTAAGGSGPVTIRFMSYNYGTPCCGAGTQQLIDEFEKANPDIRIRPEAVAAADVLTKLRTEIAAGSSPDVVQLGWSKAGEARATLPLVPVQDIPTTTEWQTGIDGIYPNILKAVRNGTTGKVDIMPFSVSVPILYYNADIFRAAGLDPDRPPTTLAEVKTAASAITRTGKQGVYVAVADSGKSDYLTQSVMNSTGGGAVNASGAVTVDSPRSIAGLNAIRDLVVSGLQPKVSATDAQAAFAGGKIGMMVYTTAAMSAFEKSAKGTFDLRTTAFPSFDGSKARPTYSGAGLAVFGKDRRRQQAAWKFIRFLTSPQGFTILTKTIGYLPLRPAIVSDPAYLGTYFQQNRHLLPSLSQLNDVTPYTYFPGNHANQAVVALQDEAVTPIVLQGADAASALRATATKIRSLAR